MAEVCSSSRTVLCGQCCVISYLHQQLTINPLLKLSEPQSCMKFVIGEMSNLSSLITSVCTVPISVFLIVPVFYFSLLQVCLTKVSIIFQALSSYQKAVQVLGSRRSNPAIWDTVVWELSTTLFTMATLLQDFPAHNNMVTMENCRGTNKESARLK
jgi:hypothetical protein